MTKAFPCYEESLSSLQRGRLLLRIPAIPANEVPPRYTPTNHTLVMQTALFTPLSIRRGDGGEAVMELG